MLRNLLVALAIAPCLLTLVAAQPLSLPNGQQNGQTAKAAENISGPYGFLREGEIVQLTVEDGRLSGYISRFGDTESDKGQFIDQFFDKTTLDGDHLTFNTKTVHGVWYEFSGTVSTTPGKQPSQEGFHVLKGKLVMHSEDSNGAEKKMERQVEFKSIPADFGGR